MIKCQPIIAVKDVEQSSNWYQKLLGCKSNHGGDTFEMLADNNEEVFLCLHKWGEHEHPTMSEKTNIVGNGLILYFIVENLEVVWENAQSLNAIVEEPIHINPNTGKEQLCLRDLDNYYLMITL